MYELKSEVINHDPKEEVKFGYLYFLPGEWDSRRVILKRIEYSPENKELNQYLFQKELRMMTILKLPGFASIVGFFKNPEGYEYLVFLNETKHPQEDEPLMMTLSTFIQHKVKNYDLKSRKILIEKLMKILLFLNVKAQIVHGNLNPDMIYVVAEDFDDVKTVELKIANFEHSFFTGVKQDQYLPKYAIESVLYTDLAVFLQKMYVLSFIKLL
jgi:hypothetical protein